MDNKYWMPRTLDDPPLFFVWEGDSAGVFILAFGFGFVMDMFIPGVLAGFILTRAYVKLKEEGGLGLMQRFLYWYTPSQYWLKKSTPSYIREYIGG